MENIIEVKNIKRYYKIAKEEKGFWASLKSLVNKKYEIKKAVDDISFEIKKGEITGFIGKNGAGKSTTIKMLSGILYPDSGTVKIDGMDGGFYMGITREMTDNVKYDPDNLPCDPSILSARFKLAYPYKKG